MEELLVAGGRSLFPRRACVCVDMLSHFLVPNRARAIGTTGAVYANAQIPLNRTQITAIKRSAKSRKRQPDSAQP